MKPFAVLLFLLSASLGVSASAPTAAASVPQPSGIMAIGDEYYVAFYSHPAWLKKSGKVEGFDVVQINADSVVLRPRAGGASVTAFLPGAHVKGEDVSKGPGLYSAAWINSKANPMLHHPTDLPPELLGRWGALTQEERDAIRGYYLKHGWLMISSESTDDVGNNFIWKDLYEKERMAAVMANRTAFAQTLTSSQRSLWDELQKPVALGKLNTRDRMAGAHDYVEKKNALEAKFKAALTPAQLTAYETRTDFTTADWSKTPPPKL